MKKSIILYGVLLALLNSCNKPDGKLSGVVTYYFNENYGDKPDVGAKIYVVNSDSAEVNFIKQFEKEKSLMNLIESYERLRSSKNGLIETYKNSLKKPYYSKEEKDEYRRLIEALQMEITEIPTTDTTFIKNYKATADSAFRQIIWFKSSSRELMADGAGTYSVQLRPGKYFVLIVSNHREGRTVADYPGQINFSSVTIESEKETTANAKFTID